MIYSPFSLCKPFFFFSLSLLINFNPMFVNAQSNGTQGGGQGVYLNGALKLRDLVDPGTCKWIDGETLFNQQKRLGEIFKKIHAVNWYADLALRREIRSLDFCFTQAEINIVDTGNGIPGEVQNDGILIYETQAAFPIGLRIRAAHEVYVQKGRYDLLSPDEQGLFLIHEALHSFLPLSLDVKTYYQKLFSMVDAISEINTDRNDAQRSFETAIRKNNIQLPASSQLLSDQNFLNYLFESFHGRRELILNHSVTLDELLRERSFYYLNLLPDADQKQILTVYGNLKNNFFHDFCFLHDEPILSILREQNLKSFHIDSFCLNSPHSTETFLEHPEYLDQPMIHYFLNEFYEGLSKATIFIKNDRVAVSASLNWISGNPALKPRYREALQMKPAFLSDSGNDVEPHLQIFLKILLSTTHLKSPEAWLNFIKQDQKLIKAFNYQRIHTSLLSLANAPMADEPLSADQNLQLIYQSAVNGMIDALREDDQDAYADIFTHYLNQNYLGFRLKEE